MNKLSQEIKSSAEIFEGMIAKILPTSAAVTGGSEQSCSPMCGGSDGIVGASDRLFSAIALLSEVILSARDDDIT